ncbi:hypothetical protein B296_00042877, partial [Ensete ventricosum]
SEYRSSTRVGTVPRRLAPWRPHQNIDLCSLALLGVRTVDPTQRPRRRWGESPLGAAKRGFYTYQRGGCPYVRPYLRRHLGHGRVVRWASRYRGIEGMARHAALMVRGEGAEMVLRPDPSASDADDAVDLAAELEQTRFHLRC